jgi:putative membrane protein insertion efficiency factor
MERGGQALEWSMVTLALGLIRLYQAAISPWLPPVCRYYPSCSAYGYDAIQTYGIWRGGWLTVRRLARCHPFQPGGYDPVP